MEKKEIRLSGDLSKISIPQIFHTLSVTRSTGIFEWTHGSMQRKVYVHHGRIVFAYSNHREERLGEVLLRGGTVRAKDFLHGAQKMSEKKRLGQILIEMGALSKDDIKKGVIEQVREIVYNLFLESEGQYTFSEKEELPKEVITLDIHTEELIMGGVRRITDWDRILEALSGLDTVFEPAEGAQKKLPGFSITPDERRIFDCVDGGNSVEKICEVVGGNDFETCRTLMAFLCANMIRRITDSEISMAEAEKAADFFEKTTRCYNRIFSYIYRYLGEKIGRLGDKSLSHYLEEIKEGYPVLLKGIFLLPDGTLAAEVLKENFEKIPSDRKKEELLAGLKALLSAELAATRESLGETEEAFVVSRLKGMIQGLQNP